MTPKTKSSTPMPAHKDYLLAIDQGTTSSRVLAIDPEGQILASHQLPITQYYPANGYVEHDGEAIWQTVLACLDHVLQQMRGRGQALAIGITNQRETCLLWHKKDGTPASRAIVWQDRRTSALCQTLSQDKIFEKQVRERTGLMLDPYFSATKFHWLLEAQSGPELRAKAAQGVLLWGTIETYLVYRLTNGKAHVSDYTNASRTLLLDIHNGSWFTPLLERLKLPENLLPDLVGNSEKVGIVASGLPGAGLPITGLMGDQQAGAIGQGCIKAGMIKSTYGTGCFLLENTGSQAVISQARLLSTIAYQQGALKSYALEGAIFNAGTVVQWLRDDMGLIDKAEDSESLARSVEDTNGVYMVPAFTGLGAPHWQAEARGLITGLTRASQKAHIVRAGLESIAYQTLDLLTALQHDRENSQNTVNQNAVKSPRASRSHPLIRIDGGMAQNNWFCQFLADHCLIPVERPHSVEATALGASRMAGLGIGLWPDLESACQTRAKDHFTPAPDNPARQKRLKAWQAAIKQCLAV